MTEKITTDLEDGLLELIKEERRLYYPHIPEAVLLKLYYNLFKAMPINTADPLAGILLQARNHTLTNILLLVNEWYESQLDEQLPMEIPIDNIPFATEQIQ